MSILDIILVILLGMGAIKGFRRGCIVEVFSFLAFFVGLFFALELALPVSRYLFSFSTNHFSHVATVVIFILLLVALMVAIKAMARAIKNALNITMLTTVDNLLGAVIGGLKSAFILSVVFWLFDSVGFNVVERFATHTFIFPYIKHIGPMVFEWVSFLIPVVKDLIEEMKNLSEYQNTVLTYHKEKETFDFFLFNKIKYLFYIIAP